MPTIKTPNGKVFKVNADTEQGAIQEIMAAGLGVEAGLIQNEAPSPLLESNTDAFLVGAGRSIDQAINIANKLGNTDRLGPFQPKGGNAIPGDDTQINEREAEAQRLFNLSNGERPLARGAGRLAPALATLPITGGVKTAAAVGGVVGGLSDFENPARGAAFGTGGGAVGFKAGEALSKIPGLARFGDDASEQIQKAFERTRKLGIKLRPSQVNQKNKAAEAVLESNLGGRGVFDAIDDTQQKTINRLAAESIGETGEDVSLEVLERARKNIGAKFREALDGNDVPLNTGFKQNVQTLGDNIINTPGVNPEAQAVVKNALEQIQGSPATIPAERYHTWQSAWRKLASGAWKKGDAQLGDFYSSLAEAADAAAEQTIPQAKLALQQEARRQWGNYKSLTRLKNTVNKQTGNVNPRTFASEVRRTPGNEDLAAITDIAALPRTPDSGTASRLLSNQLLPGGVGGAVGAAVADDPVEGAVIGAGSGLALSRLATEAFTRGGLIPEAGIEALISRLAAGTAAQQGQ